MATTCRGIYSHGESWLASTHQPDLELPRLVGQARYDSTLRIFEVHATLQVDAEEEAATTCSHQGTEYYCTTLCPWLAPRESRLAHSSFLNSTSSPLERLASLTRSSSNCNCHLQKMAEAKNGDGPTPLRDVVAMLLQPDLDIASRNFVGKRVLLRADFNVPVEGDTVTDASRITAVLPTIQLLLQGGAKLVLASHFGRPEPKKQTREQMAAQFSLRPVAEMLQRELGGAFRGLAPDCIGADAEAAVAALADGQVRMVLCICMHACRARDCMQVALMMMCMHLRCGCPNSWTEHRFNSIQAREHVCVC